MPFTPSAPLLQMAAKRAPLINFPPRRLPDGTRISDLSAGT